MLSELLHQLDQMPVPPLVLAGGSLTVRNEALRRRFSAVYRDGYCNLGAAHGIAGHSRYSASRCGAGSPWMGATAVHGAVHRRACDRWLQSAEHLVHVKPAVITVTNLPNGRIEFAPHVNGACVFAVDENDLTKALVRWLW